MFGLAERLGMTAADLLERISAAELVEWMAYARLRANSRAFDTVDDQLRQSFKEMIQHGKR